MIYIGIDPGLKGGYSWVLPYRIPEVRAWDEDAFIEDMRMLANEKNVGGDSCIAAVEKVGAVSGNGIRSMFTFGRNAGFIEGVLSALDIPYQLVPPTVWKKSFSLIHADKKKSIEVAKNLYPEVGFRPTNRCRVDADGMAEAALIMTYAKRNF